MRKGMLFFVLLFIIFPNLTVKAANVTLESEVDETIGIILDFDGDFLHIIGESLTPNGYDDVILQLGDAPMYDLITGLPVSASIIRPGMEARAAYYYDPEYFPQAVTIWFYPNHENAAVFTATVSDNIQHSLGHCVFLSTDGRYRITLTDDTFIFDPTYGPLAPEDIEPGQVFFAWVDMITASSPALVYPEKIVIIIQP